MALAGDPAGWHGPAAVRLGALHLVAEAVNLDGVLQGGAGFRADSPTSRRRREAAFLPVQALTEVQLRASTTPSSAASPGRPTSGVGW